jgi:hypothetical protein
MKSTTGIYDASLGARSNETSGIAIQRRNVQAQTSNFHFIDNLTRSLRHTGRILVDLIPKIYDTERVARIVGEDGEQRVVKVNTPFEDNGKPVLYALDAGKYDVTVDVGPSFASKRQEAVQAMLEVIRAYPQLAQFASDLLVKNMDFPGADALAERLKKTIPPELLDDNAKNKEIPPQIPAQMQQMQQMIEGLTGQLNEANEEKKTKLVELESKERIEMAKLENQATIELAKLESNEALKLLASQIAELDQRTKMLGMAEPIQGPPMPLQGHEPMGGPPQDYEDFSQVPTDGAQGAFVGGGGEQEPTGGYSPGTPMGEEP